MSSMTCDPARSLFTWLNIFFTGAFVITIKRHPFICSVKSKELFGRLECGSEDGWLHYRSTTALGSLWIAGASSQGPWLFSIDHSGVAAEIGALPTSPVSGPGLATFMFANLAQLHAALDRVYKLAVSLPDAHQRCGRFVRVQSRGASSAVAAAPGGRFVRVQSSWR
jgi:hypothetical protein